MGALNSTIKNEKLKEPRKITTFSKGQGEHPVVVYTDGTNETPEEYTYVILSLKTSPQQIEIIVLGTATQINNFEPVGTIHPSTLTAVNPPFSIWMLGETNHGYDYNGTDGKCNTCHGNLDTKPKDSSMITSNGWCYRCHYGKEGDSSGFIDMTALSAATSVSATTTSAPTTTTIAPTITQGAPAFEALLAISVLLAMVLVRRI